MTPDLFRQFMLSSADPELRDQLRERLIADQDLSDQLRDQETDWIDACAAGALPPADAQALREHLQRTGQLHRLATAAALLRPKPAPRSVFPYAFGLAATVLLVFSAVFHQPRSAPPAPQPELPVVTVSLVPGTLRDGRAQQTVTAGPNQPVLLQLQYQDTAPQGNCRVHLFGQTTETIEPCGLDFHPFSLPAGLAPGRYTVALTTPNGEPIHIYTFTLQNQP